MELEQSETFCCEETTKYSIQMPMLELKKKLK